MQDVRSEVVVAGMGAVTPFGIGADAVWDGACKGECGVDWMRALPDLDPAIYPVRHAAEIQEFSVDEHVKQHCEVRGERGVQMGLVAAAEALNQAGLLDGPISTR